MIEPKNEQERVELKKAKHLIGLLAEERDAQLTFRAMALGFQKATPAEVATAKRAYIDANAKVAALIPRAQDALIAYFAMIEEQRRAMHLG
jgi:hypothetical protein